MDLVEGVLPVAVGGQRGEVLHQHGVVGPGCRPKGEGAPPQPGGKGCGGRSNEGDGPGAIEHLQETGHARPSTRPSR